MKCPNCGSQDVKVLAATVDTVKIQCKSCLSQNTVVDKELRAQRLKAEADAMAADKIKAAVGEATSGIQAEIKDALKDLDKASADAGEKVYESNINAILEIATEGGRGSGFLVNPAGYAITNTHVVVDENGQVCRSVKALCVGQWVPVKVLVIFGAPGTLDDIAIIKLERVPHGAATVKLGDSDAVKTGQQSFVIGNSRGMGTCIMAGIIADKNRGGFVLTNDMAKHGNSGGPLFTRDGKVFSVLDKGVGSDRAYGVTANKEGVLVEVEVEGMNLSIPINHVKGLVARFERETNIRIL